ncbi:hypothetical protein [Nocardia transvalensis]|uniref:hypothetical protein n=1 Tax=Nocardia transvalensis TaxID=37333 RepID=UPI0018945476|nr:hypothetical protein [Nocardia transvalensis]MBF6329636.1 hypothetical protein [Nocardia transvalensis]
MTTTTRMCSAPCRFGDMQACGGADEPLTYNVARRILGTEHAFSCTRWLAAVAFLSAGLDDD